MFASRNVRQMFCTILLFKGRLSFAPNTLNNQISTYFLAHHWQQKSSQGSEGYTYENWIKLIEDVNKLNRDYINAGGQNSISLFNDWNVYGDGMALAQYQAIGILDLSSANPISIFQNDQKFPITSKIGQHKSAIADQDTDAQMYSKWYGLQLRFGTHFITKFGPTSFRNISKRIQNGEGSGALKADWFLTGKMSKQFGQCNNEKSYEKILIKELEDQQVYLRKSQYRYNSNTKVSSVIGYLTKAENSINTPNMQGWRKLIVSDGNGSILVKSTANGLLIDLANAVWDQNNSQFAPDYPSSYELKITCSDSGKTYIEQSVDIQKIANNQGGLIFIPGIQTLLNKKLKGTVVFGFQKNKQKIQLNLTELEYYLCANNPSMKSKLSGDKVFTEENYLNEIQFDFYCTRYGKKVDGELIFGINSHFQISDGGIYPYKSQEDFKDKIQHALSQHKFKETYESYENIKQSKFQGKLSQISKVMKNLSELIETQSGLAWSSKKTKNVFSLQILEKGKIHDQKLSVKFVNGKKQITFALNQSLTSHNNPRNPVCKSLNICGEAFITDEKNVEKKSQLVGFSALFYETDKIQKSKIDWAHNIAPILKMMGLLYPSMQKIVNLYDFQNISMPAMKRAFDIEDQTHPRYMPSTRQISQLEHRKLRKWLYEPLFNSSDVCYGTEKYKKFINCYCIDQNQKILKTTQDYISQFNLKKKTLINTLKSAFTLELTTIPLYLSAMFSVDDKKTKDVLRSVAIDEMKHLFIVSNVLNAIHDNSLLGAGKAIPYTDPLHIPKFPTRLPIVLKAEDSYLQKFLQFDILPSTADQILRFICIQVPGQLNYLSFNFCGTKSDQPEIFQRVEKLNSIMEKLRHQNDTNQNFKTIGQVYSQIIQSFWYISDLEKFINETLKSQQKVSLFTGDPRKQFTYFGLNDMAEVYDLRSALNQFRLIVEQGEGANLFSNNNQMHMESHFIKFIEIYTGCQVQPKTLHQGSSNASVIFELKKANYQVIRDSDMIVKKWSHEQDIKVNAQINKDFCSQSSSNPKNYDDIYAKPSFLNAYEKIMKQFDFIFNTELDAYKQAYLKSIDYSVSDLQLKRIFQVARRAKMQNAIAKMRQMTLHADRIIKPLSASQPYFDPQSQMGSRPDYNINFDSKASYKCPTDSPKKK